MGRNVSTYVFFGVPLSDNPNDVPWESFDDEVDEHVIEIRSLDPVPYPKEEAPQREDFKKGSFAGGRVDHDAYRKAEKDFRENNEKYQKWSDWRSELREHRKDYLNGVTPVFFGHCEHQKVAMTHEDVYFRQGYGLIDLNGKVFNTGDSKGAFDPAFQYPTEIAKQISNVLDEVFDFQFDPHTGNPYSDDNEFSWFSAPWFG